MEDEMKYKKIAKAHFDWCIGQGWGVLRIVEACNLKLPKGRAAWTEKLVINELTKGYKNESRK